MPAPVRRLTIAIPTHRRPRLLERMLGELARQTRLPDRLIVVDGAGGGNQVRAIVRRSDLAQHSETVFVPSTRANLPFQRWLARRLAEDSDNLIFFDDDLLLPDPGTVAKLAAALDTAQAATCTVQLPAAPPKRRRLLWRGQPGALTPGGSRRPPADDGSPLPPIEWLRGAAMAFRCGALPPGRFPLDLFALAEVGAGMGEELALARCLQGRIVLVRELAVEHPDTESSQVLSSHSSRKAFAVAYSRRLLNDLCHSGSPTLGDRAGLAWTWCGGLAAAVSDGFACRRRDPWLYVHGYLRGVVHGVFRAPTHERLTPTIDWEREARRSLDAAEWLTERASTRQREDACRAATA